MDFIVKGAHYRGLWRSELLRLGCCETIGVSIRGWDLRSCSVVTGIRTGALAMRIERRWVMKVNEEVRMVDLVALEYPPRQLQARWLLWVIFWGISTTPYKSYFEWHFASDLRFKNQRWAQHPLTSAEVCGKKFSGFVPCGELLFIRPCVRGQSTQPSCEGIFWRGTHRWLSSNYAAGGQYPHTAGSTAAPCAGGENRSDPLLPTPVGLLCLKGKLQPMKTDGW